MTEDLEPLIHSPLRLSIMSILIGAKEAEFNYLKEKTGATSGNLSVQIHKLGDAGYLKVEKSFRNNFPLTTCRITREGIAAFEKYVKAIRKIIE